MKTQYIQLYRMADVEVGAKLTLEGDAAKKTMREFKNEVKLANEELLNTQARFGATSKEALAAAKKVAMLKDNIQDANETVKLFDLGNKFQTVGNAVRGLVGGFTALQGALALVGVEGDEVQKTLLKVQGALALTEGLNVIADVGKDFKRLGSIIVQTLGKSGAIGLAIAGVAALGLALAGVFTRKQTAELQAYNDTLKDYNRAAATARQTVTEVKIAFEQARAGVISKDAALKIYNDTLGDSLGKANDINQAEKLLADKADTYIKITALKAQANALFAKSAEQAAEALIAQDELLKSGILNEGGVVGTAANRLQAKIEKAKQDAKDIENLGAGLLRQAGTLSQTSGISTGPKSTATGGKATTPAGKAAEKETEEVEIIYATRDENRLLREQELQANLIANKQFFIEEGKALEQQEFDEKIALLNAELDSEEAAAKRKVELAEWERNGRVAAAKDIGNALGALSELIGKQTAAGKALAIAQAVINTWVGVSEVLRAKSALPEPFATISKIANVAVIIATGLNAVKNIGKAQVPGAASGGSSGGSLATTAPLRPVAPQATNTLLNQQQLNQIGNATVRAYVTETDVTNNQERIRRLNRAARI